MSATSNIYLPLQFKQLVDLVKTLPKKEKQQLIDVLNESEPSVIPEWQKKEVNKRIKKHNKQPELLIDEKQALKFITKL